MKIRQKLLLANALTVLGLAIFCAFAYFALNRSKVGGPLYNSLILGKDLIADILPPPEYIIESYLLCFELEVERDPERIARTIEKGNALWDEYEFRQAYWLENYPEGELKTLMTKDASVSARAFFKLRANVFIPAIRSGEYAKAHDALVGAMKAEYENHRQVIDRIVEMQNQKNAEIEAYARVTLSRQLVFAILLAILIVGITVGSSQYISTSVSRRLKALDRGLAEIAAGGGDLTREMRLGANDEITGIGESFNRFVASLRAMIRSFNEVGERNQTSANDLASNTEQLSATTTQIAATMNAFVESQVKLDGQLQLAMTSLEKVAQGTRDSSGTVRNQSELILGSSKAMDEFGQSVRSLDQASASLNSQASALGLDANRCSEEIAETTTSIGQISQAAQSIFETLSIINAIADQINLLALNAAIEAAHAGDSGRGFAVVADEIRKLASATAENAQQIGQALEKAKATIQDASGQTERSNSAVYSLIEGIHRIDSASKQMASSLGQAAQTGVIISGNLGQLRSLSELSDASVAKMSQETGLVKESVAQVAALSSETTAGLQEMQMGIREIISSIESLSETGRTNADIAKALKSQISQFVA